MELFLWLRFVVVVSTFANILNIDIKISMAVQRGNAQCVQGAYGESAFEELDEIFCIVQPNM